MGQFIAGSSIICKRPELKATAKLMASVQDNTSAILHCLQVRLIQVAGRIEATFCNKFTPDMNSLRQNIGIRKESA